MKRGGLRLRVVEGKSGKMTAITMVWEMETVWKTAWTTSNGMKKRSK